MTCQQELDDLSVSSSSRLVVPLSDFREWQSQVSLERRAVSQGSQFLDFSENDPLVGNVGGVSPGNHETRLEQHSPIHCESPGSRDSVFDLAVRMLTKEGEEKPKPKEIIALVSKLSEVVA